MQLKGIWWAITLSLCMNGVLFAEDLSFSTTVFGQVYLNQSTTLSVTVTNIHKNKDVTNIALRSGPSEPFAYSGGTFPGAGGDCDTASLAPNASCRIVFRFLPTSIGTFTDSFSLNYSLQRQAKNISNPISGVGIKSPPLLALYPSQGTFGTYPVGSSASVTFLISNSGQSDAPLSLGAPSGAFSWKGGSFPGTGGTCSSTLTGGSSCTCVVSFAPTSAVNYSSGISLSATGGNSVSATLSGTGQSPQSAGTADTSFGSSGSSSADTGATSEYLNSITGANGSLVAGGFAYSPTNYNNDFVVTKFLPNGSPDTGFNGTGSKVITFANQNSLATSTQVGTDGSIFVSGYSQNSFAISKLTPAGGFDTSFAGTGILTFKFSTNPGNPSDDFIYDSILKSDGKLLLVGASAQDGLYKVALVQLTPTGAFDTSFNGTGKQVIQLGSANSMAYAAQLDASGKIVIAGVARGPRGYDMMVARFTSDGALDASFGTGGYTVIDFGNTNDLASSLGILPSGKIVLAGSLQNSSDQLALFLAQLNADGTLDASFGTAGKVRSGLEAGQRLRAFVSSLTSGDLLVSWYVAANSQPVNIRLTQFQPNGTVRSTYGTNGTNTLSLKTVNGQIPRLTLDAAGRVLPVGRSGNDLGLLRIF